MKWVLVAFVAISVCSVSGFRIFPLRIYPVITEDAPEVTITESVRVKQASDPRKFSVRSGIRVIATDNVVSTERVTEDFVTTGHAVATETTGNADATDRGPVTANIVALPTEGDVTAENVAATEKATIQKNVGSSDTVVATESDATVDSVTATENATVAKNTGPLKNVVITGVVTENVAGPENLAATSGVVTEKVIPTENIAMMGGVVTDNVAGPENLAATSGVVTENVIPTENIVPSGNIVTENSVAEKVATKHVDINAAVKNNHTLIATTKSVTDITVVTAEGATSESTRSETQNDLPQIVISTESSELKTNAPAKESDITENIKSIESVTSTEDGVLLQSGDKESFVTSHTDSGSTAVDYPKESVGSTPKLNVTSIVKHVDFTNSFTERVTDKVVLPEGSTEILPTTKSVGVSLESNVAKEIRPTKDIVSTETVGSTEGTTFEVIPTEENISTKYYESFGIFTYLIPPKTEFRKYEPDPRYDY